MRVPTVAFWFYRIMDNMEYDLAATPCDAVARGGFVHYPTGVSNFPQASPLVKRASTATWASRSLDARGASSWGIWRFSRTADAGGTAAGFIFRIFAARTTAE